MSELIVIGGGLAGSEAAWQAAQRGIQVRLYEMRPGKFTPAHTTAWLAEIICSNSLGSDELENASGLLKAELRSLGSLLMACADRTAVPAGKALAVDRELFARCVTEHIESHPRITVIREEVTEIPDRPCLIATGPLTSDALAAAIQRLTGQEHLYFYDAISPIVAADSIDMSICFKGSRYGRGQEPDGDYLNCPMTQEEYEAFVDALIGAETIELRDFEREDPRFFEACLPIEVLAKRGREALAYGPLRPTGLIDPRTGRPPYAVVQLRRDNRAGTMYSLVGFQTNLKWPEQRRVFRMIPGLQNAEFLRYGQMHRNTYINAPALLEPTMQFRRRPDLFFAGQITGAEGYVGNIATGLVAGVNAARLLRGQPPLVFPRTTMIGALCDYLAHADPRDFQPMKANFGLLPPLERPPRDKRARALAYARRALEDLRRFWAESGEAAPEG
ncbi:methylenetetrahydrofolate--tRNA-(uracil(54)-C(5))-methyltransferase (FADH(2)-oxidizing) TrmFO [Thermoflexus sp.]|uniref:methylenetetrahydrofolate--tRNA-(uracil(54)- C(5))-methyltransferase (FADH(2)-oxidizing) TrmFO n=1 Tax=Thermoflexus sp. TaxID=1969742 RepID=UPI0025E4B6CE|nr:methylenetetrahydrofolate--tRNA-(uracil(54)-C(5))-methyltransferase (FADH(2)-oxidizing) TrmFO [Thermoflexus sp.]MCS7350123.1 methylenetetrahydrofolate--tRNA-(uracil(54)-C(5))-methyltransferase (FADH(2)-oxidizing) TrmFO [Thermoflexus sp.]MCX7689487.1 methylenetetrahydrofolate--tRNA-(uracil(54)-C(5))-methyltransferase (FADH(2)-oxidizing) TrmFO [Thermoflexus sp.]MDW8179572.1 methylenetetrahydrofolate--tRNA-(uracil(54)-C(5))-methyltransferase (FADH(2)-oxidizing) TrmFO [Anaerolineae bacterium]MDW